MRRILKNKNGGGSRERRGQSDAFIIAISYIGRQTKQNRNKELRTIKIQIRLGLSLAELKS